MVYTNFFTPGMVPVELTQLVLDNCEGQTGVTSTPDVGAWMLKFTVWVRDVLSYISTCGEEDDRLGNDDPLQSPYTTNVTL